MTAQHHQTAISEIADIASRLSVELTHLKGQLMVVTHVQEQILEDFSVFNTPITITENEHLFYEQACIGGEILKCYRTSTKSCMREMNEQLERIFKLLKSAHHCHCSHCSCKCSKSC